MDCRCPNCNRLLFKVEGDTLAIKCKCGCIARGSIQRLQDIVGELGYDGLKGVAHGDLFNDDSNFPCGNWLFYIDEGGIQINCRRCKAKWQYSLDDFSAVPRPEPDPSAPYWDYEGGLGMVLRFPGEHDS